MRRPCKSVTRFSSYEYRMLLYFSTVRVYRRASSVETIMVGGGRGSAPVRPPVGRTLGFCALATALAVAAMRGSGPGG